MRPRRWPWVTDALHGVQVLVVNESEAQALTGSEVSSFTAAGEVGRQLSRMGIPVVILTLGARGALLVTSDQAVHVPARRVDVVDTTAAGDAFVGALAVALLRGMDLVEATRYATCAGTLATMTLGAQPSLPTAEQVQAFYEGGPF
jgi:ribokinase